MTCNRIINEVNLLEYFYLFDRSVLSSNTLFDLMSIKFSNRECKEKCVFYLDKHLFSRKKNVSYLSYSEDKNLEGNYR